MEHTPGPWHKSEYGSYVIDDSMSSCVADCDPAWDQESKLTDAEIEANARLIAAAPDLLEACEQARKAISTLSEDALGFEYERWVSWPLRDELLDQLERAIAKAKGESDAHTD